jgi:AraC-like DNA-binding protein
MVASEVAVRDEARRIESDRASGLSLTLAGATINARGVDSAARFSSARIAQVCERHAARMRYQGMTLRDLCAVSDASERRVRDAFYDCYGISPTAYLRAAALHEVRRTLLECPQVRDPVTRAASDCGFWHLSRFASQYRALFGESPSETLARRRTRPHDARLPETLR